jgi:hypothetical protein
MLRRIRNVLAIGLATLALPGGLRAGGNLVLQGQTSQGVASAANQTPPGPGWVDFDGRLVSDGNVHTLLNDPVVDWGPVLDSTNHNVDGELWVTVARNDKGITYHLTEQHASGAGSYSGYTVVSKTVHTQRLLNYGQGEDVPLIGNDRDAFVIATSEIFVSSTFLESGYTVQSVSGAPPAPHLVSVARIEHAANLPTSTTATRKYASRWLAPDGSLLRQHQSQRSYSGTLNCVSFGAGIGGGVDNAIDVAVGAFLAAAVADGWFAVGVAANQGFPQLQQGQSAAVGYAVWLKGKAGQSFRQISGSAKSFMTPLAAGAAASACEQLNLGIDALLGLAELEFPTVESTCSMQSVCTETESQLVGSVGTTGTTQGPNGESIETIDVVGVTEDVCTDSEIVVVCG